MVSTRVVTVHTPPERVWPWLVQIGRGRAGWYSYDWLDRLFGYLDRPSTNQVLPEYQQIAVGDVIPIGRGGGFPVKIVQPNRLLVLGQEAGPVAWVWTFALCPSGGGQTRLVSRNRVRVPRTIGWRLFMWALEPAAFLMTRRMLLGIKQRAEALATRRRAEAAD